MLRRRSKRLRAACVVLSDMAANMSDIVDVDPDRMYLVEFAVNRAKEHLVRSVDVLVKGFQGRSFRLFMLELRKSFKAVKARKQPASRQRSPELYLSARDFCSSGAMSKVACR